MSSELSSQIRFRIALLDYTPKKWFNYRGISLTCISAKVYNKLLLHRPHVEPLLRINQNGFRPNRDTVSQILTIRRLIEGIKEKNLPAVLTFVDFRKALDSIHREKLWYSASLSQRNRCYVQEHNGNSQKSGWGH